MSPQPTGRVETRDGVEVLVLERRFAAAVEDVWAAVTEPDRLARWIGTWTGDPASGSVQFTMTAEGDDVAATTYEIRRCEPPVALAVDARDGSGVWELALDLVPGPDGTTLRFTQRVHDRTALPDIGPGWEYYLDRLVVAEAGGSADDVVWDDYHPVMSAHYSG